MEERKNECSLIERREASEHVQLPASSQHRHYRNESHRLSDVAVFGLG